MKILVLSDSHSSLSFMRDCVRLTRPDGVIHLGDYYEDGLVIARENPALLFWQVPGNCDRYRIGGEEPESLLISPGGVRMLITHGHRQYVKSGCGALLAQARQQEAAAALFGHTHAPLCQLTEDGIWLLNPGSCGYFGGSAGMICIENGKISSCRLLRQQELEEMV